MSRALLVGLCVLLVVLAFAGMRRGWLNRARRQAAILPELPTPPVDVGAVVFGPATGLYVGSAFAASWQDRVVHGGLGTRAAGRAVLHAAGLVIERDGSDDVFIPAAAMRGARVAPGLTGKVTGAGGLLVVQWDCGDQVIDTAFRADDKRSYPQWVSAIESVASVVGAHRAEGAPRD